MMPKNSWKKGKEIVAAPLCAHKSNEGTTYCVKCGEEADGVLWPLSPSPEIPERWKDDYAFCLEANLGPLKQCIEELGRAETTMQSPEIRKR